MRLLLAVPVLLTTIASAQTTLPSHGFPDPSKETTQMLCRHWKHKGKHPDITAELKKRNEFSADDWKKIEEGVIYIGMPENAMVCSLGMYSRANTTVSAYGQRRQYVFENGARYVYTENGKVTSWQY